MTEPARDLAPPSPDKPYAEPAFANVARMFGALFRTPRDGGGALVVKWRGRTVVDLWKGYADQRGEVPWTRDTGAICCSATKGVSATVIHRLADRGLIGYDEPVAAYWPEFGAAGKDRITVRQVLSHTAGLDSLAAVAGDGGELFDHLLMEDRLAAVAPAYRPGAPAYHGFTLGWLLSGLARRVTGQGMADLYRSELAGPLGVDGLNIGRPRGYTVAAEPVGTPRLLFGLGPLGRRLPPTRRVADALVVPGMRRLFDDKAAELLEAEMPAVNGVFTAEGFATLYGAIANGGAINGRRLLSPETVAQMTKVQTRALDRVLGIPMMWRLGYHQATPIGRPAMQAFGHVGYGGSSGWADPVTGVSVGYVTNRLGPLSMPSSYMKGFLLGGAALAAARRAAKAEAS